MDNARHNPIQPPVTHLTRATYAEALTMLRFGVAVRRAGWEPGEYVRRHMVTLPAPHCLPSESEIVTRAYLTAEDKAATDWSEI